MCVNFEPVGKDVLREQFHLELDGEWKVETWQDYAAPIIRAVDGVPIAELATFGLVPQAVLSAGKRFSTMNARIETVSQLRSFAKAWTDYQFCLIPMLAFMEPCYESGKAVRWRIGGHDGKPFAVAGLWRSWPAPQGGVQHSFTMLTTNADHHPFLARMHKPDDEKRSLIVVPPTRQSDWLNCRDHESARSFLHLMPEDWYDGAPHPLPPRAKKSDELNR